VCVFFNICAAAASDLLFDIKSADLVGISRKKMYQYQWIGLLAASLCIGIILWLLFTHLELGSEALFAQRGKAKALLLQSLNLDSSIVLLGLLFGWILKQFKVNSTMVFGGLVMPNSVTIGLALGSLATLIVKKPEKLQPLSAGILAAESLWIMGSIILSR
jgi:membrane protease YdiL (CAAX protease family)